LGEKTFRDRLLGLLEKPASRRELNRSGEATRDRSLNEAERLVRDGLSRLGLPVEREELSALRKGEPRKVWLAMLLRKRTVASNAWIAERLAMGEPGSVSRLVGQGKADPEAVKKLKELEEMLK
jgi:hypothetical protein